MLRAVCLLLLLVCAGWCEAAVVAPQPDTVEAAMALPAEMRDALEAQPSDRHLPLHERVQRLVDFMVADDGLALRYQEQPTYGIAESYAQRKVNCLSFTLTFIALARASGMRAYAQASDNALAMRVINGTLYRATHVNAGVEIGGLRYTVDVGWRTVFAGRKPRPVSDAQAIALLHNNHAVEHLLQGDRGAATTEIAKALVLDPANATAWSNAGVVELRSGRREAAERAYLQALTLQPRHIGALNNLVSLYRVSRATLQADSYHKRLQHAQASDPFSQFQMAQTLANAGAYDDAIAHYRRAIRLLPGEPQFHRSLADAYQQQGDEAAAVRSRNRATSLEARQAARRGIRDAGDPGPG